MTGLPIPPQLIAFGLILVIVVGSIGMFADNTVDSTLVSGDFREQVEFNKESMYLSESFYTGDKTNIPVNDEDGNVLYDIFIGKGYMPDTFEMFINGSEKGITSLDISEYIPENTVNLAYTTLIFALKIQCPAGVPIIQFIRVVERYNHYQYESLGTEMSETFPEVKDYYTTHNNSEGNIVDDIISWVSAQVHEIIDRGLDNWLMKNNWLIGIVAGCVSFIPIDPFKMF